MARHFGLAAIALCGLGGWAIAQAPGVRPPLILPEPTLPRSVVETLPPPTDVPPLLPSAPSPASLPPASETLPVATDPEPTAPPPATGPASKSPAPLPTPDATSPPPPKAPPKPALTIDEVNAKVDALAHKLTVTTGDGDFQMILGGAAVADFLYSTKRPFAPGTPFFLFPPSPLGFQTNTFDAHARQSNVYANFSGPEVFDFKTGGFIYVNFYNDSVFQDRYGVLPINAFGELRNEDWRFAAGLQMDVFNPLNPTVLPFSLLATSGNTGMFRGQARVERFLHPDDDTLITLTVAASEPVETLINDQLRFNEDNGLPNLEGRVAIGLGTMHGAGLEAHRPIEAGVSAVCGQLRTVQIPQREVVNVWGVGADFRWAADPRWGFQGEVYCGQGLGTYGANAFINVNSTTLAAIRGCGGWAEVFYYWCGDAVHTHLGYGIDDPRDADMGAFGPIRNETYYITTIWDVTKALRVGFQASYLRTTYAVPTDTEGFIFQTQFMWKF
jgi:hypothetical protein